MTTRFVLAICLAIALVLFLSFFMRARAGDYESRCLPYSEMVEVLASEYQEHLAYARPFPNRIAVALIFVSRRGTWTEIRVNRLTWMACVAQVGSNWPVAPPILYWAGERT